MAWERRLGRSLAFCCHPAAAWRVLSPSGRGLVVSAWFGASYLAVLVLLIAI